MMELELLKRQLLETLDGDPALRDLADRSDRLDNFSFSEGLLTFEIIRHPCVEGLETKGMPSPGFWEVKESYSFNPLTRDVSPTACEHVGLVIEDIQGLVEQDVRFTVEGSHSEITPLGTEEDVEAWASGEAKRMAEVIPETKYLPQDFNGGEDVVAQWKEYVESYVECWQEEFKKQALAYWLPPQPGE